MTYEREMIKYIARTLAKLTRDYVQLNMQFLFYIKLYTLFIYHLFENVGVGISINITSL